MAEEPRSETPSDTPIEVEISEQLWLKRPEHVLEGLQHIRDHKLKAEDPPSADLLISLSRWLRHAIKTSQVPINWPVMWLEMGHIALHLLENWAPCTDWKQAEFVDLLLEKHKRYGIEALCAWEELGMAMRVDSKIDRLANMVKFGYEPHDNESIVDTVQDILGYSILGLYMHEAKRRAVEIMKARQARQKIILARDQADVARLTGQAGELGGNGNPPLRLRND